MTEPKQRVTVINTMKMQVCISIFLIALLCIIVSVVHADTVHKWVDENGVTHYSDQAPKNTNYTAKQINFSDEYATSEEKDDYYSIVNQWARMHEERLNRKKLQLEKAALKQAQAASVPQVLYIDSQEDRYRNYFYPSVPYRYNHHRNQKKHYKKYKRDVGKKYSGTHKIGLGKGYKASGYKSSYRGSTRHRGSGLKINIR